MIYVGEFRQKFRRFPCPHYVRRSDPFPEISGCRCYFVTINRRTHLQTIQRSGACKDICNPRPVVIVVSSISGTADDRSPPISHTEAVAQPSPARRNIPFREEAHEVYGNKRASKADHFRPTDARLQPSAVMKRRIPISYWRVIAPKRQLEVIIVVIP